MDEEKSSSSSQAVSPVENVICIKWKQKHDQSLCLDDHSRNIGSIDFLQSLIADYSSAPFRAQHLEFYEIDFSDFPTSFWELRGEKIKSVKFSFCILEFNTLSSIINHCTSLVTFGLRTSDSFVETSNPSFSQIFENLIEQGKTDVRSVQTLQIVLKKTNLRPCHLDQTILNLLKIFPNFKNLTLEHNCDACNYSSPSSSSNGNSIFWNNIFDLIKRKSADLKGLNIESFSSLQINRVRQQALNRQITLKAFRLTELTVEMVPVEEYFPASTNYIAFLRNLKSLKTVTCKLLHHEFSIDSDFLNKFLRSVIYVCHELLHLKIEYFQTAMRTAHNQWNVNFDLLRDILSSNLMSLRIHVDCCDIFLNSNREELDLWWNDTIESLSVSFICKTDGGKQQETMAAFISRLQYLRYLHLGGDINDDILKSIWIHQKSLKSLSLYVFISSLTGITEAGFIEHSAEMCNNIHEEEGDLSETLEYLRFEVQKEEISSENKLKLPFNIFKKFCEFKKLHHISFSWNIVDGAETIIRFCEQLKNFEGLKSVFIECKVKVLHIDFLYNSFRYCKFLETIYVKNNHTESGSFTNYQYKDLFRYCDLLKLFIHENGKAVYRGFKEADKIAPKAILDDKEIYLISTDVNDMVPNFWFSSL